MASSAWKWNLIITKILRPAYIGNGAQEISTLLREDRWKKNFLAEIDIFIGRMKPRLYGARCDVRFKIFINF